ncbi:hypothetical protein G6F65_019678 [Rhizopus arrhizus]|nr:hypothetical protein G6F65_019678 [Rhizopus arrhizus]
MACASSPSGRACFNTTNATTASPRRFDFHRAQAVARHVQHVVDAAHDPEVAVRVALRAVAGQVVATQFRREVALLEAFRVAPDVADHRRPRTLDDEEPAIALVDVAAGLIHDGRGDARQRQRARTRLGRRGARQRGDHVAAGFSLPPRIQASGLMGSPTVPMMRRLSRS